jgi:hypothetical protein
MDRFLPNTREDAVAVIFRECNSNEPSYTDIADALGFLGVSASEVVDGWRIIRQASR